MNIDKRDFSHYDYHNGFFLYVGEFLENINTAVYADVIVWNTGLSLVENLCKTYLEKNHV